MNDFKLPPLSVDLIPLLEQMFPNEHPKLTFSDREVWFKAGQAYVVQYLKARLMNDEQDEILT